jgi:hypothetical protein
MPSACCLPHLVISSPSRSTTGLATAILLAAAAAMVRVPAGSPGAQAISRRQGEGASAIELHLAPLFVVLLQAPSPAPADGIRPV